MEPISETIKYSDGSEKIVNFINIPEETIVSESLKEDEDDLLEVPEESSAEVKIDEDQLEESNESL